MGDGGLLKINDVSKILGVSSRKLRRYCNANVVPGLRPVRFGKHRTFTTEQVDWLRQAVYLSRAGFSTKDLRKYVKLMQARSKAADLERREMLRTHKRQAWQQLEDLRATIGYIERQEEMLNSNTE